MHLGGILLAKKRKKNVNHSNEMRPKRASKRERTMKIFIYIMVIAMFLSLFTAAAAFF